MTQKNKAVLITGANSGIGESLVSKFIQEGYFVLGIARSAEKLKELQSKQANFVGLNFDITKKDSWSEIVKEVESIGKIPSIIILNAGTCEYMDKGDIDEELVRRVFEVNFFANVIGAKVLLKSWRTQLSSFVVTSSSAYFFPLPRAEAYGASKAALSYFFRTLRLSYPEIVFTIAHPGFVETPLTDKNDFSMPMKLTADKAASTMYSSIIKGRRKSDFPWFFIFMLKLLGMLPDALQYKIGSKLVRE